MNNEVKTTTSDIHKITINEFINAGTYKYINVTEGDKEYWMAIPNMNVEKGATYFYKGGMIMKDFESEQLNRTFDFVTFVEGISENENMLSVPKSNNAKEQHDHKHSSLADVKIEKPKNGSSIQDLYKNKLSLNTKTVTVRGIVSKVNNGILKKNWIHLVDGTSFEDKTDITITSTEIVKVGDTLTFKGAVALDKDFGYGYVYALLLENGEIVK